MTLGITLFAGLGFVLIASAIENVSLAQFLKNVFSGQPTGSGADTFVNGVDTPPGGPHEPPKPNGLSDSPGNTP